MSQTSEALKNDIENTKKHISEKFNQFEDQVEKKLNWKNYVTQHPLKSVGFSVLLGVLLSNSSNNSIRSHSNKIMDLGLAGLVSYLTSHLKK